MFTDPNLMRDELREKNKANNKCRLVAGYCYEWKSRKDKNGQVYDIVLDNGFSAKWNFADTNTWAIDPDSFDQVGCIHTSQGLEFEYVGVIIGLDLRYEGGRVITDPSKRAKSDFSLRSAGELDADRIIRNTYKTLMSRGLKGCYVYCQDPALGEYLSSLLG